MLIVSDIHLGKSATFRAHGMALPEGDTADDLARLELAVQKTSAKEVMIVGDLFHASSGRSAIVLELLCDWRKRHQDISVKLIVGNHDVRARPPKDCEISILGDCHDDGPFHFVHDPEHIPAEGFSFCGHLHPQISLGSGHLKTACFWETSRFLVLPSFGGFTGGKPLKPSRDETYHAVAEGKIHRIPGQLLVGK